MGRGKDKKKRKRRKSKPEKPPKAKRADRYALYQKSVQDPPTEVAFLRRVYRKEFGEKPYVLREDFCGTFAVCCDWARRGKKQRAIAVDLDPEPLAWGREHNLEAIPKAARRRVTVIEGDARSVGEEKADVVAAENFSWFIFHEREELLDYFRAAYANLADRGVFVLDMMGGGESMQEDHEEERECDGFDYVWEHARFDPITHRTTCFIHFRFDDGSEIERAFRYDWRVWTIPETRQLLHEAGFTATRVYWEDSDSETGEGTGTFRQRKEAEADPSWIAYLVGVKGEG